MRRSFPLVLALLAALLAGCGGGGGGANLDTPGTVGPFATRGAVTLTPDQVASIDQGHPGSELKPL